MGSERSVVEEAELFVGGEELRGQIAARLKARAHDAKRVSPPVRHVTEGFARPTSTHS